MVGGINLNNKEFDVFALYVSYMKALGLSEMIASKKTDLVSSEEDEPVVLSKGEYRELIDLALATGDKEWFLELTEKMESVAI